MIKKYFALTLIAASVAVAGCSDDDDDNVTPETPDVVSPDATPGEGGSVYDTIVNSDQHTSLRAAIDAAGLANTLDDESLAFTVFAPDDAAFAALNTDEDPTAVVDLLADVDALTRVLQYHVVAGTSDSVALSAAVDTATEDNPATFPTLVEGQSVTVTTSTTASTGLAVNTVDIAAADLVPVVAEGDTTAGIVHSIVAVLEVPEEVVTPDPDPVVDPGTEGDVLTVMQGDADGFDKALAALAGFEGKLDEETSDDPWSFFIPTDLALDTADTTLDEIVAQGPRKTPAVLLTDTTVTTRDGKVYAVGGTETELTIGGAPATVIGGSAGIVYKLTAVPVAN